MHIDGTRTIIDEDLDRIFQSTSALWEELRGKRLFLTGGTGFFGSWLLGSFIRANSVLDLNASVVVLTRNYDTFKDKFPDLATNPAIHFHIGDVKHFEFPEGAFSHVIHAAATSAAETFNDEDILNKFDTVVCGTRRVLDFAVHCGAEKLLYTSSGVVYGKQPPELTHIPEDYAGAPDPLDTTTLAAWGSSKRAAEFLCGYHSHKYGIEMKIARCFSFIGPGLPLDIHYAAGNFIRDALKGGPVRILGDGTPRRSYLYTADLIVWLWTILFRGATLRPYNVGSDEDMSIADLAQLVAANFSEPITITIAKAPVPGAALDRYVPATARVRAELGLEQTVSLQKAIQRTLTYCRTKKLLKLLP